MQKLDQVVFNWFAHNYKLKLDNSVLNVFIEVNHVMFMHSLRNWPSMPTSKMHASSLTMKYSRHDTCCVFCNELCIKANDFLIIFSAELRETCV